MDIILNLLKHLSASLSPIEFFIVVLVVLLSVMIGIIIALKLVNGGNVSDFFLRNRSRKNEISNLKSKVDDVLLTQDAFEKLLKSFNARFNKLIEVSENKATVIQENARSLQRVQQEIEHQRVDNQRALGEINANILLIVSTLKDQVNLLKAEMAKIQEHDQQIISRFEKVDELVKVVIPEFKSYYKDIFTELNSLSRDVAILERTVQAQINTYNAINLR